jgi:hypothetical protein
VISWFLNLLFQIELVPVRIGRTGGSSNSAPEGYHHPQPPNKPMYKSKFQLLREQKDKEQKEKASKEAEEKWQRLERKRQYSKMVKELYKPAANSVGLYKSHSVDP